MKPLQFIEETLRDGQQSLWATRMETKSMLPIAPAMDAAGFYRICVMAPVSFETSVMYLGEDPFERLKLLRRYMPNTALEFQVRSRNLLGWRRYPDDVIELMLSVLKRIGIDWIRVFDGLNDLQNLEGPLKIAKAMNFRTMGMVVFTESPVHTDAYFVQKMRQVAELGVDAVGLADASGVMRPDRARGLLAAARRCLGAVEFDFNAHTNTGLANDCCREAIELGVDVIMTTSAPLSYGPSLPATIDIMEMARESGRSVPLDERRVREIDDWFHWVAYAERKPVGVPVQYAPRYYDEYVAHQIPGGMISNLKKQLFDLGIEHRLPEVLIEAARVRAELGYPVMVTPFSQFVGVQATLNVVEGERYRPVPREMRLYARGYYGELAAPVDRDVLDRILGDERDPVPPGPEEPLVSRVRAEQGPFESDEDLLLALFMNQSTLKTFYKKKRAIAVVPAAVSPLSALISELARRAELKAVRIEKGNAQRACLRIEHHR